MPNKRTFLPFGEWLPDQKLFLNSGLVKAENVVPVYGNLYAAPSFSGMPGAAAAALAQTAYGLGAVGLSVTTWNAYVGTTSKIYEITNAGAVTDRSGAAYATPDSTSGSQITAFGQSVIETRYTEPPQILLPAAGTFVPLHSATFAPAGRFPFSVRGNLFMAHCFVPAPYDAVPAGANPQLVAWSQTDAPRFYGGPRVDPQLVGSDYQQIANDYGVITGAVGGNYGLVFQQRAVVRVDGPPYTFQEVVRGKGTRYPNSIVQNDQDTYFWGDSGPSILEYGGQLLKSDQATALAAGKLQRTLLDNSTSFDGGYSIKNLISPIEVSGASDLTNRLIFWAYSRSVGSTPGDAILVYNIEEKRFTIFFLVDPNGGAAGALFLRNRPNIGGRWRPGSDQVFINRVAGGTAPGDYVGGWSVTSTASPTIKGGYVQLDPDITTRIIRVRPILTGTLINLVNTLGLTLSLVDTNDPFSSPAAQATAIRDEHGWFLFQDSRFADFHSLAVTVSNAALAGGILEAEGFEVEYVTGAAYSA